MAGTVRVLVAGAYWPGDVLAGVISALTRIGVEVSTLVTNPRPTDAALLERLTALTRRWPYLGVRIQAASSLMLRKERLRIVQDRLGRQLRDWKPHLFLALIDGRYPILPEIVANHDEMTKIGWLLDDPFWADSDQVSSLRVFDALWTVEESLVAPLGVATGRPVRCVPLGVDPDVYHRLDRGSRESHRQLVFVGKSYRNNSDGVSRAVALSSIAGKGLEVWGDPGWTKWKVGHVDFGAHYRGGPVPSSAVNEIYNSAQIVLNIHHSQIRIGTSLRAFAICAAGAFQAADWRPGLDALLEPDREIVTFRCGDELAEKVDRYLKDDVGRQRIAVAGERRALCEHTYERRLRPLIAALLKERRGPHETL